MGFIHFEHDLPVLTKHEEYLLYHLIRKHIEYMPKTYRKSHCNWVIVGNLTLHGYTNSTQICAALNVDPESYVWEKNPLKDFGNITLKEYIKYACKHYFMGENEPFLIEQSDYDFEKKNICPLFKGNNPKNRDCNSKQVTLSMLKKKKWLDQWVVVGDDETSDECDSKDYYWLIIERKKKNGYSKQ